MLYSDIRTTIDNLYTQTRDAAYETSGEYAGSYATGYLICEFASIIANLPKKQQQTAMKQLEETIARAHKPRTFLKEAA